MSKKKKNKKNKLKLLRGKKGVLEIELKKNLVLL